MVLLTISSLTCVAFRGDFSSTDFKGLTSLTDKLIGSFFYLNDAISCVTNFSGLTHLNVIPSNWLHFTGLQFMSYVTLSEQVTFLLTLVHHQWVFNPANEWTFPCSTYQIWDHEDIFLHICDSFQKSCFTIKVLSNIAQQSKYLMELVL